MPYDELGNFYGGEESPLEQLPKFSEVKPFSGFTADKLKEGINPKTIRSVLEGMASAGETLGREATAFTLGMPADILEAGKFVANELSNPRFSEEGFPTENYDPNNKMFEVGTNPLTSENLLKAQKRYTPKFGDESSDQFLEGLGGFMGPSVMRTAGKIEELALEELSKLPKMTKEQSQKFVMDYVNAFNGIKPEGGSLGAKVAEMQMAVQRGAKKGQVILGDLEDATVGNYQRGKVRRASEENPPRSEAENEIVRQRFDENYESGMPIMAVRKTNEGKVPTATPLDASETKNTLAMYKDTTKLEQVLNSYYPFDDMLYSESPTAQGYKNFFLGSRYTPEGENLFKDRDENISLSDMQRAFNRFYNTKMNQLYPKGDNTSLPYEEQVKLNESIVKEYVDANLAGKPLAINPRAGEPAVMTYYPDYETFKERKKAVDIAMNEIFPQFMQKYLGTDTDPMLNLAREGITTRDVDAHTYENADTFQPYNRVENMRIESGFPAEGITKSEYLTAKSNYDTLLPQVEEGNRQVAELSRQIIATGNPPQSRPEWVTLKNAVDKMGRELAKKAEAVHNAKVAYAYEQRVDEQLDKMRKDEYLNHADAHGEKEYQEPHLKNLKSNEPVYRIRDADTMAEASGHADALGHLINDILTGVYPITDSRKFIKNPDGTKEVNENFGLIDAELIRNINIPEYVRKITKTRIEKGREARKSMATVNENNAKFAKNFLEQYKATHPEANDYGNVVPVRINNQEFDSEEIRQQNSLTCWELDHCSGRGGQATNKDIHYKANEKRTYFPMRFAYNNAKYPGAAEDAAPHITNIINGSEDNVDFRDKDTGLPVFTLQLQPDSFIYKSEVNIAKEQMEKDFPNNLEISQTFYDKLTKKNKSDKFTAERYNKALDDLIKDHPQFANDLDAYKIDPKSYKNRISYFMGYKDRMTMADSYAHYGKATQYRDGIVKWLNDNQNIISATSKEYLPENGILDVQNGDIHDALSKMGVSKADIRFVSENDFSKRFETIPDIKDIINQKKIEIEPFKNLSVNPNDLVEFLKNKKQNIDDTEQKFLDSYIPKIAKHNARITTGTDLGNYIAKSPYDFINHVKDAADRDYDTQGWKYKTLYNFANDLEKLLKTKGIDPLTFQPLVEEIVPPKVNESLAETFNKIKEFYETRYPQVNMGDDYYRRIIADNLRTNAANLSGLNLQDLGQENLDLLADHVLANGFAPMPVAPQQATTLAPHVADALSELKRDFEGRYPSTDFYVARQTIANMVEGAPMNYDMLRPLLPEERREIIQHIRNYGFNDVNPPPQGHKKGGHIKLVSKRPMARNVQQMRNELRMG